MPSKPRGRKSRASPKRPRRRTSGDRGPSKSRQRSGIEAVAVTTRELKTLRRALERRARAPRWNPDPDDVQKSVAQLVLTVVEFLRKLMERQAIRRMDNRTLNARQSEAVGAALMRLEKTIHEMGRRFGLTPEDLNLDLGPLGKLM